MTESPSPSPRVASYGSWNSPITSDLIVARTISLGEIRLDGDEVYWSESRPSEGGRSVVVRRAADGRTADVTPPGFNARTRVHEYGGGAFTVDRGAVYFSNFADQRLYRQDEGAQPAAITPETALRYADGVVDRGRSRLICVREDHTVAGRKTVNTEAVNTEAVNTEAVNTIVAVDLDGASRDDGGRVLVAGNDFYASPRLSPDGARLAWLTWRHPNMPWDGTELWVGELTADGAIGPSRQIAGGEAESIFQPEWSPNGELYFCSDRTGWWNLYRWRNGQQEPLTQMEAELGAPQWVFGLSTYAFESPNRLFCRYDRDGISHLASLDTATGRLETIEVPFTTISGLRATAGHLYFVGGSPEQFTAVVHFDARTRRHEVLRRTSELAIDPAYLSRPQAIEFPTEGGKTAHAFYYPPKNRDFIGPATERPPLVVHSHGGPTSATTSALSLSVQYWTSRGIAYLDVNYGGSTGYGREYRRRLYGQWGVVDVDDCVSGAAFLAERGEVDGNRLAIAGGSAGGYTTLCGLAFRTVFKAGASYYGVSDLEALAKETHKFESRYLDQLIGPYPERRDLYVARSPIHFVQQLSCPVIFFQGLDDPVVPPNQAEKMVQALEEKGLPVAYVPFAGERHGFRKAENIKRALDAELYFYAQVFHFPLADAIEPVPIANIPAS